MSKGLKLLNKRSTSIPVDECYCTTKETIKQVKKELKALEIIKRKEMLSVFKDISGKCFIVFNTTAIEIPQEEYDLLKEVLL